MQSQLTSVHPDQAVHTASQSLQAVESVLKAAFGCITFLRGLLPSDNFGEGHLTSSSPGSQLASNSFSSSQNTISNFRIKVVSRGFTEEADKLLNYLEHGIFDALQKQYLRSFIFAIYLDDKDPNNIVEAYTFNFTYSKLAGTETAVPVMTLGDGLLSMSLNDKPKERSLMGGAAKEGRPPTIGEVKKAVRSLIKALLTATSAMEQLPARRFATFKLFYYDNTPEDYEPPHFRPGDAEKDKFFFSTHRKTEVPEKCSVGTVMTPYHGVDVHISSVASFLPSAEDNTAAYAGLSSHPRPTPDAVQESANRLQQIEQQESDAKDRQVVWAAENEATWGDEDAEGEIDDDSIHRAKHQIPRPLGVRTEEGHIVPLPETEMAPSQNMDVDDDEIQYSGVTEVVPSHIAQLLAPRPNELEQTQRIEDTQSYTAALSQTSAPLDSIPSQFTQGVNTQIIHEKIQALSTLDEQPNSCPNAYSEMLDIETQAVPLGTEDGAIDTFTIVDGPASVIPKLRKSRDSSAAQDVVDCDCGVAREDCDCCCCEGGCGRWYHLWCMGYQSDQDSKLPAQFICFDCKLRGDVNFEVVAPAYPSILSAFQDLALYRRAIKIAEAKLPATQTVFHKEIGCEGATAAQLCKRLEEEGFIAMEVLETDGSGLLEAHGRLTRGKSKSKAKKPKVRKNLQKARYVFIKRSTSTQLYRDYFNPTPAVQMRLVGFDDILLAHGRKPSRQTNRRDDSHINPDSRTFGDNLSNKETPVTGASAAFGCVGMVEVESQTQEETQYMPQSIIKRKMNGSDSIFGNTRSKKKVKISVGAPVDLGD